LSYCHFNSHRQCQCNKPQQFCHIDGVKLYTAHDLHKFTTVNIHGFIGTDKKTHPLQLATLQQTQQLQHVIQFQKHSISSALILVKTHITVNN